MPHAQFSSGIVGSYSIGVTIQVLYVDAFQETKYQMTFSENIVGFSLNFDDLTISGYLPAIFECRIHLGVSIYNAFNYVRIVAQMTYGGTEKVFFSVVF